MKNTKNQTTYAQELMDIFINKNQEVIKNTTAGIKIPTGFIEIDKLTSGWNTSNLIIVSGKNGMGKRAFAVSTLGKMAIDYNVPVALFSSECSSERILNKIISHQTKIPTMIIERSILKPIDWSRTKSKKLRQIYNAPIFLNDAVYAIDNLEIEILKKVILNDIKVVIIYELPEIAINKNDNSSKTYKVLKRLKEIAIMLDMTIIVLTNLTENSNLETFKKKPIISDLNDEITKLADLIAFIYRPEYYAFKIWDDITSCENEAEFIIAKNNNGMLGNARLKFNLSLELFSDLKIVGNKL